MSKLLKKRMAQELSHKLEAVDSFVLYNYQGLKAQDEHGVRKTFFDNGVKAIVVKNTIASICFAETYPDQKDELKELLKGPTAIAYGGDSIAGVAKTLLDLKKQNQKLEIKGGYIPGSVLTEEDVKDLSKIPPREVLLSMMAGAFKAPMREAATAMNGLAQKVVYAMNALVEKMEENSLDKVGDAVAS